MIKIKKIIGMFEKIVFKRSVKTQKKKKKDQSLVLHCGLGAKHVKLVRIDYLLLLVKALARVGC